MYPSKSQKEKQKITKFWQNGDLVVRWTQLCFPTQAFLTPSPPGRIRNYEEEKILYFLTAPPPGGNENYVVEKIYYVIYHAFCFFPSLSPLAENEYYEKDKNVGKANINYITGYIGIPPPHPLK